MTRSHQFYFLLPLIALAAFVSGCSEQSTSKVDTAYDESSPAATATDSTPAVVQPAAETTKTANKLSFGNGKYFSIYGDGKSPDNHFAPSGWMGDYGDLKINDKFLTNPHSGTTSIQIVYSNKATQGARWAGIYWQNPPNNWGTRPGGFDLTGASKLTFWARGEKGGERIEEFKIGGITGEYPDSDVAGIGPVILTTEWTKYEISLEGKDLTSISGGFCWAGNLDGNPEGATFYLDDIRYE